MEGDHTSIPDKQLGSVALHSCWRSNVLAILSAQLALNYNHGATTRFNYERLQNNAQKFPRESLLQVTVVFSISRTYTRALKNRASPQFWRHVWIKKHWILTLARQGGLMHPLIFFANNTKTVAYSAVKFGIAYETSLIHFFKIFRSMWRTGHQIKKTGIYQ